MPPLHSGGYARISPGDGTYKNVTAFESLKKIPDILGQFGQRIPHYLLERKSTTPK